jgi:hypothetical protein
MSGGESQISHRDWCGFMKYLMTQQYVRFPVGMVSRKGRWKFLSMSIMNWMLYKVLVVKEALQLL